MARYFFNVRDGSNEDLEGSMLSGDGQAREQAITMAAELLRFDGPTLSSRDVWEMSVLNETGRCLFTLRFSVDDHPPAISQEGPP
jgi:uncharacterized protein DUF6894